MSLVVSLQKRELPPQSDGDASDYDWQFAVDRCDVVRDEDNVRIFFWRNGIKEIGPGLTIPCDIAPDVGAAMAVLVQSNQTRIEIDVPSE